MKQIAIALIIMGIGTASVAVVRTYTNEVRIESIKEIVIRIERKLDVIPSLCE